MNTILSIRKYCTAAVMAVCSLGFSLPAAAWHEDSYNWKSFTLLAAKMPVSYGESEFDSKGRRTRVKIYDLIEEVLEEEIKYELNAQGQPVKLETYNARGKLQQVETVSYDSQGRRIKEEVSNRRGKLQEYTVYKYDSQGNLESSEVFNAKGRPEARLEGATQGDALNLAVYEGGDKKPVATMVYQYDKDNLASISIYEQGEKEPLLNIVFEY